MIRNFNARCRHIIRVLDSELFICLCICSPTIIRERSVQRNLLKSFTIFRAGVSVITPKIEGQSTQECSTHLHQLHVCLPSSRQKTRLLYRMSLDFAPILKHVPFMKYLWRHFANKVQLLLASPV
ncbi:hypothetical protein ACS0TY_023599 [Phlomoides rotata]